MKQNILPFTHPTRGLQVVPALGQNSLCSTPQEQCLACNAQDPPSFAASKANTAAARDGAKHANWVLEAFDCSFCCKSGPIQVLQVLLICSHSPCSQVAHQAKVHFPMASHRLKNLWGPCGLPSFLVFVPSLLEHWHIFEHGTIRAALAAHIGLDVQKPQP